MPASAHDVASELRRRLPDAGAVKIHKLLYYAQGWSAVATGEPMFFERIEAWANGPVVATLWAAEKHGPPLPEPVALGPDQLAVLDYVVRRYGGLTGRQLIDLTHNEPPWRDIGDSDDPSLTNDQEITIDSLCRWFEQDEEQIAHREAVEQLRKRASILAPIQITPAVEAALRRAANR